MIQVISHHIEVKKFVEPKVPPKRHTVLLLPPPFFQKSVRSKGFCFIKKRVLVIERKHENTNKIIL